jgi:hypothetical protein
VRSPLRWFVLLRFQKNVVQEFIPDRAPTRTFAFRPHSIVRIQGFGASGLMSVNTALIRFIYPSRSLGRGVGNNVLVVRYLHRHGPTIAAGILSLGTWQWLFAVNVAFGIVAFALALRTLPDIKRATHTFDFASAALNAATLWLPNLRLRRGRAPGRHRHYPRLRRGPDPPPAPPAGADAAGGSVPPADVCAVEGQLGGEDGLVDATQDGRRDRGPAIGAAMAVITGHGTGSRPVCTALNPRKVWKENGSATKTRLGQ